MTNLQQTFKCATMIMKFLQALEDIWKALEDIKYIIQDLITHSQKVSLEANVK